VTWRGPVIPVTVLPGAGLSVVAVVVVAADVWSWSGLARALTFWAVVRFGL
jgi:hypothetical protein